MYVNGMRFRGIERVTGVHHTTIIAWVKQVGHDQIISKTYMTRVEGENTRLRHDLARLYRKTLCYSKSEEMLRHSIRLLLHYLKFWDVPVPA
jgi:IS1 transposase